jgi:hypothetical protein
MKLPSPSLGRPLPGGPDLGGLAIGVKLLQLRHQAGALGRGGDEGEAMEYSSYRKYFTFLR